MKYFENISESRTQFIIVLCVCALLWLLMNIGRVKSGQKVSPLMWFSTLVVSVGVGSLMGGGAILLKLNLFWTLVCTGTGTVFSERIIQWLIEISQDPNAFESIKGWLKSFISKKLP